MKPAPTLIREEIMVLPKDIDNPYVDRRVRRNWQRAPVIKQGTRLRFRVYDVTEQARHMVAKHLTEEQMKDLPTEHQVEISKDDCFAYNRLSFNITYRKDSETGDCHFGESADDELTRLLWEACQPTSKTSTEVVDEVIRGCAAEPILAKLLDLGRISREDLEDAYNDLDDD